MANKVEINACKFETIVKKGNIIIFKSTDNKEYTLSCGSSNNDVSDDLPLTVQANGASPLKIKNNALSGSYNCEIIDGCSEFKNDTPRPTMIIKVE